MASIRVFVDSVRATSVAGRESGMSLMIERDGGIPLRIGRAYLARFDLGQARRGASHLPDLSAQDQ